MRKEEKGERKRGRCNGRMGAGRRKEDRRERGREESRSLLTWKGMEGEMLKVVGSLEEIRKLELRCKEMR